MLSNQLMCIYAKLMTDLEQLDDIQPPLPPFILRDERLRLSQAESELRLRQLSLLAGVDEQVKHELEPVKTLATIEL